MGAASSSRHRVLTRSVLLCGVLILAAPLPASAGVSPPLAYHGGPVMHANRTHVVFWSPASHPLSSSYMALVQRFFTDVAADSGKAVNAYAISAQYRDASGAAAYASHYAGALTDRTPFPSPACSYPGVSACVTGDQIAAELAAEIARAHLPDGLGDMYLVFLAPGVGVCRTTASTDCAFQDYCAYHDFLGSLASPTLFSVIPYPAVAGCRAPSSPNGNPADYALTSASHEQMETITDPLSDAWNDANGDQMADKCLSAFGPYIGRTRLGGFNQLIGGHPYELQEEWSNLDGRCEQRSRPIANLLAPPRAVAAGRAVRFDSAGSAGTNGTIRTVAWSFGDGGRSRARAPRHAYRRAGRYTITLAIVDDRGYAATAKRTLRVR